MEGSSLLGFFQLKVMILPVMDSITGIPSGGSGSISRRTKVELEMHKSVFCQIWARHPFPVTCYIKVSVAGGLSYFVRNDTLVDTTMGMTHRVDDQAVDIANCREKQWLKEPRVGRYRKTYWMNAGVNLNLLTTHNGSSFCPLYFQSFCHCGTRRSRGMANQPLCTWAQPLCLQWHPGHKGVWWSQA